MASSKVDAEEGSQSELELPMIVLMGATREDYEKVSQRSAPLIGASISHPPQFTFFELQQLFVQLTKVGCYYSTGNFVLRLLFYLCIYSYYDEFDNFSVPDKKTPFSDEIIKGRTGGAMRLMQPSVNVITGSIPASVLSFSEPSDGTSLYVRVRLQAEVKNKFTSSQCCFLTLILLLL